MLWSLGNHLLPQQCLVCAGDTDVKDGVCRTCTADMRGFPEPVCTLCGASLGTPGVCLACTQKKPPFDIMRGAYSFEGIAKDMIHAFKYGQYTVLKSFLAKAMVTRLCSNGSLHKPDFITAVPMHWTKVVLRGYNQSMLLAQEFARQTGYIVRFDVITKFRNTQAQAGLSRQGRKHNMHGVFKATGVKGKSVLIIDDVITTGKTAYEVSKAMKAAGAKYVCFFSFGRVP